MAMEYKNAKLVIYPHSEWDNMTTEQQTQARNSGNSVYVVPDGIDQVLDTDTYGLSDLGNAELFLAQSGGTVYYDAARRLGYIYGLDPRNGCTCWVPDPDDTRLCAAVDAFAHIISDMEQAMPEYTASVESATKVKALRKILLTRLRDFSGAATKRIIERIHKQSANPAIVMDDVARTGHLVNCPNGTLDLRTCQLRPARKDDYISQGCPTEYHPGARTEAVDGWLDSICVTPEIRRLFLQALGEALNAANITKTMPILYGSKTNNGKTTTTEIIIDVVGRAQNGGYGQTINPTAFNKGTRTGGRCTPELATVVGSRVVMMSEPHENENVDWAYIKEITGGGSLHVNPKNKPAFTAPATFTPFLDTNYLIRVDDPTLFKRGTMQIIPFLREFSKAMGNLDDTLRERMAKKENREAIADGIRGLIDIVGGVIDIIYGIVEGFLTGDWSRLWEGAGSVVTGIFDTIGGVIKGVANLIISLVNAVTGALNMISIDVPEVLGGGKIGFDIPQIPSLASGGVAYSEQIVRVGEYAGAGSNPELIAPQSILADTVEGANGTVVDALYTVAARICQTIRDNRAVVTVGGKTLADDVTRQQNDRAKMTGKPILAT